MMKPGRAQGGSGCEGQRTTLDTGEFYMGRHFASEASLVEGAARPSSRARSLRRPELQWPHAPLHLVSASSEQVLFAGRTRAQAPLLLSPLFLVLASLPWLASSPVDALQLTVSAFCLAGTVALVVASWPRHIQLRLRGNQLELLAEKQTRMVPDVARWVLRVEDDPDAPHAAYTAALELEGGQHWTLLRHSDPSTVLVQLRAVLKHWPRPVECHWGLPKQVRPWIFEPAAAIRAAGDSAAKPIGEPRSAAVIRAPMCGTDLLRVMAVMTLLTLTDLVYLVLTAGAAAPWIHPLSIALPVLMGASLVALSLGLASARARLVVMAEDVRLETGSLGFRRSHGAVRLNTVRGAHVVGTLTSERWHVLVDSADGPLAMPVRQTHAQALAERVRQAMSSGSSVS